MNPPLLSVRQLSLHTPSKTLFKNIEFDLSRGELLAIMGPSGIGKSMLARAISGFTPDSVRVSGSIRLSGSEVAHLPLLHRTSHQKPAYIFQDALQALNPLVSVSGQLSLAMTKNRTKPNPEMLGIITELLSQLGFANPEAILAQYPGQLSGGQRQRICIAIGLLSQAELVIADEPTSALDPVTEQEILTLLRDSVKQKNIAGILITHDLSSALKCDKLMVIDDGSMVAFGSPLHAIECSTHAFCRSLKELIA